MADADSSRNRLQVDERRAQLLDLGLKMFAGRSYNDISIDEIARTAGVSKGLLYHYFRNKRAFYLAALREAARQLLEAAFVEPSPELSPLDRMRAGLEAYMSYVEQRSQAYAFLLRGGLGGDPDVRKVVEETRDAFFQRLLENTGVTDNERLHVAARGIVGMFETASLEWVERKHLPRQELVAMLAEIGVSTIAIALRAQSTNAPE